MTQSALADRLGRSRKTVNQIIKGKAPLTAETALQLERVLGVPAAFWSNRERYYREHLARLEEQARLQPHVAWGQEFPIREMMRRGWIRQTGDKVEQLRELLNFFGVASPQQWRDMWLGPHVAFRKSPAFQASPKAVAVWLRKGELDAQSTQCASFDAQGFRDALSRVRALTTHAPSDALREAAQVCAQVGVAVVVLRELRRTRVWGATRWLSPQKALLQLSCRYKRDDHLWFSFFHEAAHILKHARKQTFVEADEGMGTATGRAAEEERQANSFAADLLIPPALYRDFVEGRSGYFSKQAIRAFAGRLGVAPGVVVGRLQHDRLIEHRHCNDLKRRVDLS